jgi:hypothetical protein
MPWSETFEFSELPQNEKKIVAKIILEKNGLKLTANGMLNNLESSIAIFQFYNDTVDSFISTAIKPIKDSWIEVLKNDPLEVYDQKRLNRLQNEIKNKPHNVWEKGYSCNTTGVPQAIDRLAKNFKKICKDNEINEKHIYSSILVKNARAQELAERSGYHRIAKVKSPFSDNELFIYLK